MDKGTPVNVMTAQGRYANLETTRRPFLDRAREAARLTIPSLVPPEYFTGFTDLDSPFQSLGSRGVNNLASKLLLALLPPNTPFFRLTVDDFTLQEMTQQEGMRGQVEEALGSIERTVQTKIEQDALRVYAFEGLKQLLVAGNVLLYFPIEGGMRVFKIDSFVVKRNPAGKVIEIIVRERITPDAVPEGMQEGVKEAMNESTDKTIEMFTCIKRVHTGSTQKWKIHQEIAGMIIPDSVGSYPEDKLPWLALRYTRMEGEDYGRGFIEEYIGDLKSLETLTQAIVEGSAISAKILFLVNPNGTTDQETLAKSENGAIVDGNADDVSVLQSEKQADFNITFQTITQISERLSFAFLLNTAIQRKGERVTAEEIRYMSQELDSALGGMFALLSQEFQLPLVTIIMGRMEKIGKLPKLPKDTIRPSIVTGLEALGRGQDLQKLQAFVADIVQIGQVKPEALARLSEGDLMTRLATARGIDVKGLVMSDAEWQQFKAQEQAKQEQMQMQQMTEKLGPEAMKQVGNAVNNG